MERTITVYHEHDSGNMPPSNLISYSKFITELLESIPEQYRESAQIDIEAENDAYHEPYVSYLVYYYRPETEEELSARTKHINKQEKLNKERDLSRLKRIYESN